MVFRGCESGGPWTYGAARAAAKGGERGRPLHLTDAWEKGVLYSPVGLGQTGTKPGEVGTAGHGPKSGQKRQVKKDKKGTLGCQRLRRLSECLGQVSPTPVWVRCGRHPVPAPPDQTSEAVPPRLAIQLALRLPSPVTVLRYRIAESWA